MNADVEKAVEYCSQIFDGCDNGEWALVKQALRDQEAEIARLNAAWNSAHRQAMENGQAAKKAEALLRECHDAIGRRTSPDDDMDLAYRITAHLGATHD